MFVSLPPYFGHTFRTTRASAIAIPMATAAKQHGKFLTTKLVSLITSLLLSCSLVVLLLCKGQDQGEHLTLVADHAIHQSSSFGVGQLLYLPGRSG